jgi:hypothetical protein
MSDITPKITENASGPAAATGDSGSVQQHKLTDQIEADKHVKNQAVAQNPWAAVRRYQITPGERT